VLRYLWLLWGISLLSLRRTPIINKIDLKNHFLYFVPLWVGVISTIPYAAAITRDLNGTHGYYHHGIVFFGWALLFMISYLVIMKLAEIKYGETSIMKAVKWIGKEVTVLYVIQWLIIGNIATIVYRSQDILQITGWFLAITPATILLGLLFVKIRNAR
jgi:hypothetical protein